MDRESQCRELSRRRTPAVTKIRNHEEAAAAVAAAAEGATLVLRSAQVTGYSSY